MAIIEALKYIWGYLLYVTEIIYKTTPRIRNIGYKYLILNEVTIHLSSINSCSNLLKLPRLAMNRIFMKLFYD